MPFVRRNAPAGECHIGIHPGWKARRRADYDANPPEQRLPTVTASSEIKARYLALQQEADFALWRAREANGEVRRGYQRHLAGECDAPSQEELEEVRQLEQHAEARYRELRAFLREHFEQLSVAA